MCGIAGIITFNSKQKHIDQLNVLNKVLHHRGPDERGFWHSDDKHILFSHNRLSVIDLSAKASQPMLSYDKRFVIIYNGEIYNYQELKNECVKLGSVFNSDSDTEVILESYRHWGVLAFKRFRGMWAFALYDQLKNQLILSRDPFGIKPLYYGFFEGDLYFASEPKALRAVIEYFNKIDTTSLVLFIEHAYLDRGDWTFFQNIKRFPHASFATLDLNSKQIRVSPERYWNLVIKNEKIKYQDAVVQLQELLINSVKLHLRSDVEIGACLSGGIDSSAIVCIGNKIINQNFKTFTIHYENFPEINEKHWADDVISYTQSLPVYVEPTYNEFVNNFSNLLAVQDEPFGSTSIFAQYAIFKAISLNNIKVVLDGQGSDEQFAGYLGFLPYFLRSLWHQKYYFKSFKEGFLLSKNYASSFNFNKLFLKFKNRLHVNNKGNKTFCPFNNTNYFELKDELEERLKFLSYQPKDYENIMLQQLCDSNIPQLLRYEDRNSMAFSIESRVPFLETDLVEFVSNLPIHFKIRNGYTKAILRDALKGILPEKVRLRTSKLGFPTPEATWLNQYFNINIPVNSMGSQKWRELIAQHWSRSIEEGD